MSKHLSFKKYTFLNAVCHTYHAGFGYTEDSAIMCEPNALNAMKDYVGWIKRREPDVISIIDENGEEIILEPEVEYSFDLEKVQHDANACTLGHEKVIIRLRDMGETGWNRKPSDTRRTWFDKKDVECEPRPWYELPARVAEDTVKKLAFVGPLSERIYIKVTDPYDQVEICAKTKGAKINADDILFACRALCCGPDRSVSKFTILRDEKNILRLMASIDNWST